MRDSRGRVMRKVTQMLENFMGNLPPGAPLAKYTAAHTDIKLSQHR